MVTILGVCLLLHSLLLRVSESVCLCLGLHAVAV